MPFVLGLAENSIQLVPDGTLIFHVILILVMVYVLNATLFKPINQILESREKRTRGRLSEAQQTMQRVNEHVTDYERSLRQARAEAYAYAEAERAEAMKERQQKVNELRAELAASIAQEKAAIQQQSDNARASLEVDAREIARELSSRVLNRSISSGIN